MGFGSLKVKAKAKNGRGSMDAQLIEDALVDSWDTLQDALEEQDAGVEEQIKEHFNNLMEGKPLGDLLYGDADDFKAEVATMNAGDKMKYFEELFAQDIIDRQSIEDSIKE